MRRVVAATALAVLATAFAVGGTAAPVASAPSPPTATADEAVAHIGQLVRIHGTGWGTNDRVVAEVAVCGNDALNGTLDCDLANTAVGGIHPNGEFEAWIYVSAPPTPCPCVLRVTTVTGLATVTLPLSIPGLPISPPAAHGLIVRSAQVSDVRVVSRFSFLSLLGVAPVRDVTYTVTNTGAVPLHNPTIDVVWGKGRSPGGFVSAPPIGDLAVGQSKTFIVRIPFTALPVGTYNVIISVNALGSTVASARTSVRVFPWTLLLLAVAAGVALLWVPLLVTIRKRRLAGGRIRRRQPIPTAPILLPAMQPAIAIGWYADPRTPGCLRLWDGSKWTEHVRPAGSTPGWYADPSAFDDLRLWDGESWTTRTRTYSNASA